MQTAAQLNGVSAHRATLALTPDRLVFSGRSGFGQVERSLALSDIVRVEAHHAEETFNLQVWAREGSWRLHVFAPLVWRFAIEDALRRIGRPIARFQDAQAGSGRRPRLSGVPPAHTAEAERTPVVRPEVTGTATVKLESGPRGSGDGDGRAAHRPVVEATLRVGDSVPVRMRIESPGGGVVTVRLVGEVEGIEPGPPPAAAQGDGQVGARGAGHADLPVLRVHI